MNKTCEFPCDTEQYSASMTFSIHLVHFLFQAKLQLLSIRGEYPKEVMFSQGDKELFSGGVKIFYSFYVYRYTYST